MSRGRRSRTARPLPKGLPKGSNERGAPREELNPPSHRSPPGSRRLPFLARAVLVTGIIACLATWVVGTSIPYFDFDDATQGIFINDLSFRGAFDASFEGHADRQERYRVGFAAQRLAYSLPLSWIQRSLALKPWQAEDLLRVAAGVFGLGGSLLAAFALLPSPRFGAGARWALVGALAAHPSLALLGRTGASFYLFAYALFWLGTLAAFRWLDGGRPAWIFVAGGVAALCALNPYPSLLCWPLAAVLLALWDCRLAAALRSRHVWAAAAVTIVAACAATAAIAAAYDTSLSTFLERLATFRHDRGHAVALAHLTAEGLPDKVTKLVDQQWLFRFDRLGDLSREDRVWTLGAVHPVVLIWGLVAAVGLVAALRDRSPEDRRALSVSAAVLLLFFTFSFPEGRYILPLLPCWGYFGLRGVGRLARRDAPRQLVLGVSLLFLCGATEYRIRTTYVPLIRTVWQHYEGLREIAPIVAALPNGGRGILMSMPFWGKTLTDLHFRMLMPEGAEWALPERFARELTAPQPGVRLGALAYTDEPTRLAQFLDLGFSRAAKVRGEASGRELWLLLRDPVVPAAAGGIR